MAASLPISAASDTAARRPSPPARAQAATAAAGRARAGATASPATANAPSVTLPLRFVLTGLLALFTGLGWLVARPELLATYHYNQYVIAVTHLFTLGWMGSVVMGAMYQLVPVALETRLHSERLAKWQFVFHLVGFTGMVWMFWTWNLKQVGHFGSVLAVGVGLFVYNLARTLARVPRWNVTAAAVAAALGWITLTVVAGLSITAYKCTYDSEGGLATATGVRTMLDGLRTVARFMARFDPISAMHAHAHLGGVGFFTLLIVGVSYKLVPMFTLSEVQNRRRAALSVALLNVGLLGSFLTILLRSPWKPVGAAVIVAALAVYGWELRAILRARKRAHLDWGLKSFLTAVALLAPLSLLSLVLAWPGLPLNAFTGQLENLYGFVGLIGVVTFAIIGMLYKIVPFLAWFGVYSRHVGHAKVPALADLYSPRLQGMGYWSFVAGLLVAGGGIVLAQKPVVQLGCACLALSAATLAINVVKILGHFVRPQVVPLAPVQPVPPASTNSATA
jgi:cbb3-type cytochrome oxidase subunit 1